MIEPLLLIVECLVTSYVRTLVSSCDGVGQTVFLCPVLSQFFDVPKPFLAYFALGVVRLLVVFIETICGCVIPIWFENVRCILGRRICSSEAPLRPSPNPTVDVPSNAE